MPHAAGANERCGSGLSVRIRGWWLGPPRGRGVARRASIAFRAAGVVPAPDHAGPIEAPLQCILKSLLVTASSSFCSCRLRISEADVHLRCKASLPPPRPAAGVGTANIMGNGISGRDRGEQICWALSKCLMFIMPCIQQELAVMAGQLQEERSV